MMADRSPLTYTFYIAASPEKVWEGFTSQDSNRVIFMGAELKADFRPGGEIAWMGPGKDGKMIPYVYGKILRSDPPKVLQYTFATTPETEATTVVVTHDEWEEDDPNYGFCGDGWPRILSRLKTLLETGKTFKPH
jgi:uncharacterized protein YndB with AHSA1/START domain